MACKVHNEQPISWSLVINDDWEREYEVTHIVKGERNVDGPYSASQAVGLPLVGTEWNFRDTADIWAFCRPGKTVQTHQPKQGEVDIWFTVKQIFSTKSLSKCQEDEITDPLLKPAKVSGSSIRDKREAMYDRNGTPILNSAHEQIRGPQNEWDVCNTQVTVEQNVVLLERGLIEPMRDTLNDAPLWGFPARSVKLSDFRWTENYYGSCYKYYTRTLVFDIRVRRFNLGNLFPVLGIEPLPGPAGTLIIPDWDRDLLDEGTKVLNGGFDQHQGAGCTITITATGPDGEIVAAALAAPGAGYAKSAIVPLFITGGTVGRQAVILVETDANGTPTGLVSIHKDGEGYAVGAGQATTQRGFWVLKRIGGAAGVVPDPDDAQHFMRYQDPKGNQAKCLLDGRGMPIALDETPGSIRVEKYEESNFLLLDLPDLPD